MFFTIRRSFLHGLIALAVGCNYLAFQVELFDDEYEANHPLSNGSSSITIGSINWESFDKDNAPEAFVFDAGLQTGFLFRIAPTPFFVSSIVRPFQLVRDKSPPNSLSPVPTTSIA